MNSFELIEKLEKEHTLSLGEYEQLIREYNEEKFFEKAPMFV